MVHREFLDVLEPALRETVFYEMTLENWQGSVIFCTLLRCTCTLMEALLVPWVLKSWEDKAFCLSRTLHAKRCMAFTGTHDIKTPCIASLGLCITGLLHQRSTFPAGQVGGEGSLK